MKFNIQKEIVLEKDSKVEYNKIFKRLYYHLYSNSKSSRAEAIIEDLSKILFIKLATKDNSIHKIVEEFINGKESANDKLIKNFSSFYPQLSESLGEFTLDSNSIRTCFLELNDININEAPSHIIGDAFQTLIGPTLRGDKGQFFTPKSIVCSMVEIINPQPNFKIIDPACGTGGFLIESYSYILNKFGVFTGSLFGIDKDKFISNTAKSICEIYSQGNFEIINQNSLDIAYLEREKPYIFNADVVVTNPPFGSKIGIKDKAILKQYNLGYNWQFVKSNGKWEKTNQIKAEQSPQVLFIELCIQLLKDNGVMGIVLPEGIFGNKGDGYIWDYLRSNGEIIAMIDCPRTSFQPSTDVKTNILFFRKCASINYLEQDSTFKVAVALNCGHDRRGRFKMDNGNNYPDDFPLIASEFYKLESKFWTQGIAKDKYYLVPRYCQENNNPQIHLNSSFTDIEKVFTIFELVNNKFITIKKGNEVGSEAYGTGDIPFIRTSDISNLEVTNDPTKSISEEYYNKYKKTQDIQEYDILMVADGRYRIGKTAILIGENTKCVIQSHVKILRVLPGAPFSPFDLLYILNQSYTINQIRNLVFIQSTLGSLGNRISELKIPIPKKTVEWETRINEFESTLKTRSVLLAKLKEFQVEESY